MNNNTLTSSKFTYNKILIDIFLFKDLNI